MSSWMWLMAHFVSKMHVMLRLDVHLKVLAECSGRLTVQSIHISHLPSCDWCINLWPFMSETWQVSTWATFPSNGRHCFRSVAWNDIISALWSLPGNDRIQQEPWPPCPPPSEFHFGKSVLGAVQNSHLHFSAFRRQQWSEDLSSKCQNVHFLRFY